MGCDGLCSKSHSGWFWVGSSKTTLLAHAFLSLHWFLESPGRRIHLLGRPRPGVPDPPSGGYRRLASSYIPLASSCTNTNTKRPETSADSIPPEAPKRIPACQCQSIREDFPQMPHPYQSPAGQLPLKFLSAIQTVANMHILPQQPSGCS